MAVVMQRFRRLLRGKTKDNKDSYSVVSSSEVTPGSLDVWIDLPDEIKDDPLLASFKHLYEQKHGNLNKSDVNEGDKTIFNKKSSELIPVGDKNDDENGSKTNGTGIFDPVDSHAEKKKKSLAQKRIETALRIIKLTALVAGWMFLTVALMMNSENEDVILHTAVQGGVVKEYDLNSTSEIARVLVSLTGPFGKPCENETASLLRVWLQAERWENGSLVEKKSNPWIVGILSEDSFDFAPSGHETRTLILNNHNNSYENILLDDSNSTDFSEIHAEGERFNGTKYKLCMATNIDPPLPLNVVYHINPLEEHVGLLYAAALLLTLYILIVFEVVNRTIAALLSSCLGIAVLAAIGSRPALTELASWLDVETLLLLFSMMLLVAVLAETGLFDYLAVCAFELTGGRTWPLINCLCLFTAISSTFLDNVTTVLLMTPVTIRLCEVMNLNPVPVLMTMVIVSNVGGAATPVGDPPNVIIASQQSVVQANLNFTTFTLHMGVGILIVAVQTYVQLRHRFRDMDSLRHTIPKEIIELRQEIAVWKRAAESLSSYSRDEDIVRKALEKKVKKLNAILKKREAGGSKNKKDPTFCSTLAQMKQKYYIRDFPLLVKSAVAVSFVIVVFFLHAIPTFQRLSLGWTALLGVILLLILSEREDLEPILARVEWSTLLFFACLFVFMEILAKLGLISWIGHLTEMLILSVGEESRLAVAILLVLWVSGLASAFVDNIPLTTMMVRVMSSLASPDGLDLPLAPLVWALSFGACLGGNGTLIGASANVVCAGVAEQHGYRFSFMEFLKIGFPIMIGNLLVATVYLLICHCVFTWH